MGKDSMQRKIDPQAGTYRTVLGDADHNDMEKPDRCGNYQGIRRLTGQRKTYRLLPVIAVMLLLGALIVLAQSLPLRRLSTPFSKNKRGQESRDRVATLPLDSDPGRSRPFLPRPFRDLTLSNGFDQVVIPKAKPAA